MVSPGIKKMGTPIIIRIIPNTRDRRRGIGIVSVGRKI
jgi:hypothetical protein